MDEDFLTHRGLKATPEYCRAMGHTIFPLAAQFTKDYFHLTETPQEIMDEWLALAREGYESHAPLKPGAADFLRRAYEAGETLVLVTACVPELCHTALRRHGIDGYFSRIFFAQELGLEKRDPRYFAQVLEALGCEAADCTLFEDSPGACRSAHEAGIHVVGVYDAFYARWRDELLANTDRYIQDFTDLL